jgi:hypothetical protein
MVALLAFTVGCERVGEAAVGWLEEMAKLTPVPEERLDYVGIWEGDGMTLAVAAEGTVHYLRSDDDGTRRLEAPLVRFEGDDIVAGFAGIESRFAVEVPPHEGEDGWEMTVDGVRLVRVSRDTGPDRSPPRHDAPGAGDDEEGVAI